MAARRSAAWLAFLVLLALALPGPAAAIDLDAAKGKGLVGEKADGFLGLVAGCAPRVALGAPKEPIVINMNIKIEHEIRVKVDKDLDQLLAEEKDLF